MPYGGQTGGMCLGSRQRLTGTYKNILKNHEKGGFSMVLKHNLTALNAQRIYNISAKSKASSSEKLSSGYRINRASDDAAGLSISEKMRRQLRGLSQGVQNSDDGVSLCQVADGALGEVSEMLHRITELSIQSANGTYTAAERSAIQREINQIMSEIDRIGDDTAFNETQIFKGYDSIIMNRDGSSGSIGDVPFQDFKLADVDLGETPFQGSTDPNHLNLSAIVRNPDLAANGSGFNLIYGNGSTSQSSIKLSYTVNGQAKQLYAVLNKDDFPASNFTYQNNTFSRDIQYTNDDGVDITITQHVSVHDGGAQYKYYGVSYEVKNNSGPDIADLELGFLFHADTAYNNNDRCEGYFVNGNRVENVSVYDRKNQNTGNTSPYYHEEAINSFSIVDVDNALPFTEKIVFDNSLTAPDYVSMGHYTEVNKWGFHTNQSNLGGDTNRMDLGFNLIWDSIPLTGGQTKTFGFQYGINALESDDNLAGVHTSRDLKPIVSHDPDYALWIQSGGESGEGMWLDIGEMNSKSLGISEIDVTTVKGATEAIGKTRDALTNLSNNRSRIGAQQNRLEASMSSGRNTVENTTAAESRIRDTDMAKEMVYHSMINVLSQTGEAMMAQANKTKQEVVSLLQ